MNNKIEKLKTERANNAKKISALQTRNKEIDSQIYELENADIISLARAGSVTPEMLAELIQVIKKNPALISTMTENYDEGTMDDEEN